MGPTFLGKTATHDDKSIEGRLYKEEEMLWEGVGKNLGRERESDTREKKRETVKEKEARYLAETPWEIDREGE